MDTLGGYRIIRKLGVGAHSDVWLGNDGAASAAIKVYRAGVSRDRIDFEIEALARISSRHVARLDDLAMDRDGVPCLIMSRLSQWSLGRLLLAAPRAEGEAVTILAPLCLAVAELHRVGVAHTRISGHSIYFDEFGAPVLARFGGAKLFGPMPRDEETSGLPPALINGQEAVVSDLSGLADTCLATLDPNGETAQWIVQSRDRDPSSFALELADRLFHSARAIPVSFSDANGVSAPKLIPSRVSTRTGAVVEETPPPELVPEVASLDSPDMKSDTKLLASFLHLPDHLVATAFDSANEILSRGPLLLLGQRIRAVLAPVRKPVWVFASLVAVGIVATTILLPPSGGPFPASGSPPDSKVASTPSATTSANPEIMSDDPAIAAKALLNAREDCFVSRSILCLSAVDQHDSAAMEADSSQIRLLQDGGVADGSHIAAPAQIDGTQTASEIVVVERLGDTVLLSVSFETKVASPSAKSTIATQTRETAPVSFSVLIIKVDDGWRIRDLVPSTYSPY